MNWRGEAGGWEAREEAGGVVPERKDKHWASMGGTTQRRSRRKEGRTLVAGSVHYLRLQNPSLLLSLLGVHCHSLEYDGGGGCGQGVQGRPFRGSACDQRPEIRLWD